MGDRADILAKDVGLFDTDRETKLLAGSRKTVDQFLESSLGMCCQCGIVSEQHLTNQDFSHLGLSAEARKVEQAVVAP